MKNCPTCGQPILPSMGESIARKVNQAQAQTSGIRPTRQSQPADGIALTLHIGNSASSPSTETTPRGYKAQQVIKRNGKRYRIRLNITNFPRRGTIGGKLTIITLSTTERTPTQHELQEQPTTYPQTPYQHEFLLPVSMGEETVPIKITISA